MKNFTIALLKLTFPWGMICTGSYFLCPDHATGFALVSAELGALILLDIYLTEYGKK